MLKKLKKHYIIQSNPYLLNNIASELPPWGYSMVQGKILYIIFNYLKLM